MVIIKKVYLQLQFYKNSSIKIIKILIILYKYKI